MPKMWNIIATNHSCIHHCKLCTKENCPIVAPGVDALSKSDMGEGQEREGGVEKSLVEAYAKLYNTMSHIAGRSMYVSDQGYDLKELAEDILKEVPKPKGEVTLDNEGVGN